MAVAFQGFSIREYAAKMRTVDVGKCWPFGIDPSDEMKKEDIIKLFLPPITVTKFRWWSHELQAGGRKLDQIRGGNANVRGEEVELQRNGSELDAERAEFKKSQAEDEKLEMVCPVCLVFTAATVNAVNAHMDSCLAQPSKKEMRRQMKAKTSKAPKKRSIAEIFAVAPQIEAVDVDESGDEDSSDGGENFGSCKFPSRDNVVSLIKGKKNIKKRMKLKKRRKKKKQDLEESGMAIVSKLKKNKKLKKAAVKNGSIAKKESLHKIKLLPHVDFTVKPGSFCNKRFPEDISDASFIRGKKPSLKCLSLQKRLKVVQTSKFIAKQQKPVFPVRSILKAHKNVIPGLNSATCPLQCVTQMNHSGIHRSDRHVRFSGKDDILGPRKKKFSGALVHCRSKLFSDSFAASLEEYHSNEHDKVTPMEIDGTQDVVFTSTDDNGTGVLPIAGREHLLNSHGHMDIQKKLRPRVTSQDKAKHFPERSVSPSQVAIHDDEVHRFVSALDGRHNSCVNAQVDGNVLRAFNESGKLIDHFVDSIHGVPIISSISNTRLFSAPSSSCFVSDENANRRQPYLSQSAAQSFNGHTLHYQARCHASPKELMNNSIPLFPEGKQRAVSVQEKCMDDGFFGLPLNSQGELIPFSSSGQGAFDQLMMPSSVNHSSSSLPVHNLVMQQSIGDYWNVKKRQVAEGEHSKDPLNLFPVQNYVIENPKVHLPARFGVTELEGTGRSDAHGLNFERLNCHSVSQLDSDLNLSFGGFRQYNQEQDQNANGRVHTEENPDKMILNSTQSTMRLMGKDLTVGRSSKVEDGKVWTDKEIIAEDCPASTVLGNSFMERNFLHDWVLHPASRKSKDSIANSLASQCSHTAHDTLMMKASESRISNPFLNWQINAVNQNGSLTFNENPSNLHSFVHSPASSGMFRGAPSFQEPFLSGAEALRGSHYLPLPSTPHISCQHIPWSPVEFNHKQNLPHATKSAFNFPFLYTDCREDVQPYWFQRSSENLPPWLLHAQRDKQLVTPSQLISDAGHSYPPQLIAGTNFFSSQPVSRLSEVSYPVKSQSHIKSSLGSTSILHPALVPVIPAVNTPAVNMECGNRIRFRDKLKSKAFGIKDPNPCKKTKRPMAKADCSTKAIRIPNLHMQKDFSAVMGLTSENFGRDSQSNVEVVEGNSGRDKTSSLGCCSNESSKDGLKNLTGIEFLEEHNLARSGPIKLTAGAKHILKPSQAADQDNSRLVHSTLPFAVATNCESAQESQKKLTKIYRF